MSFTLSFIGHTLICRGGQHNCPVCRCPNDLISKLFGVAPNCSSCATAFCRMQHQFAGLISLVQDEYGNSAYKSKSYIKRYFRSSPKPFARCFHVGKNQSRKFGAKTARSSATYSNADPSGLSCPDADFLFQFDTHRAVVGTHDIGEDFGGFEAGEQFF